MSIKQRLIYERDKNITLPPPARSPFEIIKGLEDILAKEEALELKKRNITKKETIEKTLADYMMTQQ
jgi:hypothetical protein